MKVINLYRIFNLSKDILIVFCLKLEYLQMLFRLKELSRCSVDNLSQSDKRVCQNKLSKLLFIYQGNKDFFYWQHLRFLLKKVLQMNILKRIDQVSPLMLELSITESLKVKEFRMGFLSLRQLKKVCFNLSKNQQFTISMSCIDQFYERYRQN